MAAVVTVNVKVGTVNVTQALVGMTAVRACVLCSALEGVSMSTENVNVILGGRAKNAA